MYTAKLEWSGARFERRRWYTNSSASRTKIILTILTLVQEFNIAVYEGDTEKVCALLNSNPELLTGQTLALHIAAKQGHMHLLKLFIEKGADIHLLDYLEQTPVSCAVFKGQIEIVKYLLSMGARLDTERPDKNPLFTAVYEGDLAMVKYLIEEAAIDPHVVYRGTSGNLKNALSFAEEYDKKEVIEFLKSVGCRLPVEGKDKPSWEYTAEDNNDSDELCDQREEIIECLSLEYGDVEVLSLQEILPVDSRLNVAINLIRPTPENPFFTLFTTGMSDIPMNAPEGESKYTCAELIMHLPPFWQIPSMSAETDEWFWPFEWLRKLAYYPHLNDTWLGGAIAVISPEEDPLPPLASNTKLSCFLLLADFSGCSPIELHDDKEINLYTVIPIHTSERDFEKAHGVAALLERFQTAGYTPVVDIERPSVADE